jgi:hypothetical protein
MFFSKLTSKKQVIPVFEAYSHFFKILTGSCSEGIEEQNTLSPVQGQYFILWVGSIFYVLIPG